MIDVKDCAGCRDDFYNGNNDLGVKRCWSADKGVMEPRLLIHVNTPPPYNAKRAKPMPSCYRVPQHVCIRPEALDSEGYWKS